MSPASANRWWLGGAVALTALKLWLTGGQTLYAIGPAVHDDKLFVSLAAHLLDGEWLGPYDQYTLVKGPMFSFFLAAVFWIGLPLLLVQQAVYAGACAAVVRVLAPWLRTGGGQFAVYAVLLWNPMSYDAANLGRVMRQNLYVPLALLVVAGLVRLFARRRESGRRLAGPAALAGVALGAFWLTREESVWLLPAVGLLWLGLAASLGRELAGRWRALGAGFALFLVAAALPVLTVCGLNHRHYGWFGTVEFRAGEFKDAYGALTRIKVGPKLSQVPVTRQMREAAYAASPAFARLRPYLDGPVGEHWIDRELFPAAERQIRGGWFVWALRDAMVAAGLAADPAAAMRHYRLIADEINAACDAGRLPARPHRTGFVPPLDTADLGPLLDGAADYLPHFLSFRGFTAYAPDSVGDYAELKPFRDLVGTRLSHAPRSPDPFPRAQAAVEEAKVRRLEAIGGWTGRALAWLGPLLLLTGLVRTAEAVIDRRPTFLLGLAMALLGACAAYLLINVLVHVTSFYNMTPAAMAAAYPLYLLALGAIVADTVEAWRRPVSGPAPPSTPVNPARRAWLVPAGAALFVFAARLREIHLYAAEVPYNDQWIIEAQQIILPWLEGTLRPWTFFVPHFEHVPVWTRLLCWLQVALTGRWDPLVQMTVNAASHAAFVWLVARWVWRTFSSRAAGFVTAVLLLGGALPFAWENIAWGFQSQFPLALLCLFLHACGSLTHPPGSRPWWLAQAAGVAGLFTLAGMWVTPLAVAAALVWTGGRERRSLVLPLAIAGAGLAIFALAHWQAGAPPSGGRSLLALFHSGLFQLGWPSGLPAAAAIVQLPWLIHAFRLRGRSDASPADRIILTLGLWNLVHAAGLALARSGGTDQHVSRYGDLLFIGTLAGALAITRLGPAPGRARWPFMLGTLLWCAVVANGLFESATEGHARYFHQTAAQNTRLRREAVQAYLLRGDRAPLEREETRWVLTQNTDVVRQLLDRPDFRVLLPAPVNPAAGGYPAGDLARSSQARWPWLLLAGLGVLGAGLGAAFWRQAPDPLPPLPAGAASWPGWLALGLGLGCTSALFLWDHPFAFDRSFRWAQLLGGDQAVRGMTFTFATPAPFGAERLQGAAPLGPVELRNGLYGTAPAGPEWTGIVLGSSFPLTKPWLVVPYAGYPTGPGNGLRLRLLDANDAPLGEEIACAGPDREGVAYWTADVSRHQDRRAQLVLADGLTGTQGWVAVAPPIPTDRPQLGAELDRQLQREAQGRLHATLAMLALVAWACAFNAWWDRRRRTV